MRLLQLIASASGLFAVASASKKAYETGHSPHPSPNATYWTTVVTTDYTTYCPSPTTFVHHNTTYTATTKTTITIPNYPCTIIVSQPPPVTTTSYGTKTVKPSGTGYYPPHGNSSTVITYTPQPSTYTLGPAPPSLTTKPSTTPPTRTPVGPSSSPSAVVTAGAARFVNSVGAIIAAGLVAIAV